MATNSLPVIEEAMTVDGRRVARLVHRGGHFYIVAGGAVLPSPTSVLRATLPKEAVGWAYACRERERAVRAACTVYARGGGLTPEQFERAVLEELRSSEPPSTTALGLEVHGRVFGGLRRAIYGDRVELPELSPEAARVVDALRAWWCEAVARPIHAERVVVGDGWAGTLDCLVELHSSGLALVDLKVTRAARPVPEWCCQVAAYSEACGYQGVTPAVLTVHPDTLDVQLWPMGGAERARWYRVFRAALDLYRELRADELGEVEGLVRSLQVLHPAGAA